MAEFMVELFVSRGNAAAVESGAERARVGAQEVSREGKPVRYVRSIFVPADETCFFLYEASSAEAVREAARRAAIEFDRIEAVAESNGGNFR